MIKENDEILKICEEKNIEILDKEYKEDKTLLKIKTEEGYIVWVNVDALISNKNYFVFHKDNPYTIDNIKTYMSSFSPTSELVSTVYNKRSEKLIFKCGICGNEYRRAWSDMKTNKKICPKCSKERSAKGQRINIKDVRKIYQEHDLELIKEQYENNKTPLACKTKDGYIAFICLSNLQTGQNYSLFHASNPYTIQNIKIFIEKNSNIVVQLLSDNYEKNSVPLSFKCTECGEIFERPWADFYSGRTHCPKCRKEENIDSQRLDFNMVKEDFLRNGLYIEEGQKYENNATVFAVKDKEGYKGFQSHGNLGKNFRKFSKVFNEENYIYNLQNYCKINNIKTQPLKISGENRHGHVKAIFKCECGNEFEVYTSRFTNGSKNYCDICQKGVSKIEKLTMDWLDEHSIFYIREKTFENFLTNKNYPYYFDFYIPSFNLIIECDGRQHEEPVCFGGISKEEALEKFQGVKRRDREKNKYCEKNNIKMIRISDKEFANGNYLKILNNHFNIG